jgi:uncharacterized protein
MLRIIRSADYVARPWKNGGGVTRDIFVSPPGASLDNFDWRLSLAQVDRDGPFSRFDNVDRTLVLLSGAMSLHEQDRSTELMPNSPFSFAGERTISATLPGGTTVDFNVMTRRGRALHTVQRCTFNKRVTIKAAATTVVFALERGLSIDDQPLEVHDTAIVADQGAVIAASGGAVAALTVEIVDFRPNVL